MAVAPALPWRKASKGVLRERLHRARVGRRHHARRARRWRRAQRGRAARVRLGRVRRQRPRCANSSSRRVPLVAPASRGGAACRDAPTAAWSCTSASWSSPSGSRRRCRSSNATSSGSSRVSRRRCAATTSPTSDPNTVKYPNRTSVRGVGARRSTTASTAPRSAPIRSPPRPSARRRCAAGCSTTCTSRSSPRRRSPGGTAVIGVVVTPLVNWLWGGGAIVAIGTGARARAGQTPPTDRTGVRTGHRRVDDRARIAGAGVRKRRVAPWIAAGVGLVLAFVIVVAATSDPAQSRIADSPLARSRRARLRRARS